MQTQLIKILPANEAGAKSKGTLHANGAGANTRVAQTFIIAIAPLQLFGQDGLAQTHQAASSIVVCHVQHCYYMLRRCARIHLVIVQVM